MDESFKKIIESTERWKEDVAEFLRGAEAEKKRLEGDPRQRAQYEKFINGLALQEVKKNLEQGKEACEKFLKAFAPPAPNFMPGTYLTGPSDPRKEK